MKDFKISCVQIASGPNIEANLLEISKYILKAKGYQGKPMIKSYLKIVNMLEYQMILNSYLQTKK